MDSDQTIREQALNPDCSFIVQAPAGSGKTELLTQRYLTLLARAKEAPEEVLALTFTRKAAAEMRERVLHALDSALTNQPQEPHRQTTWQLAQAVLKKDQQHNWQLRSNPQRLKITTIDSLCAQLSAQMPLLAGFGAQPGIIEDARPYYLLAAQRLLTSLPEKPHWQAATNKLLLHLDNQVAQLENLLASILAKREQWLPHMMEHQQDPQALRKMLELGLRNTITEKLLQASDLLHPALAQTIMSLAQYAATQLQTLDPTHPITHCQQCNTLPESDVAQMPVWLGIANMLLTQKGEWRKSVTKRIGFPAGDPRKAEIQQLLGELQDRDDIRSALHDIILCPPAHYADDQWTIVSALVTLLPVLAAQLHLIFQEQQSIDFVELNLAALRALGDQQHPTDLALYLDYRLQHLLVDEFQDTSVMQFNLLEKLMHGWQPNDGRSIFLVGDPMQSIYRFRNAEVGLFLRAQQLGIANIPLHNLTLQRNFRSAPTLVNWVNQQFLDIFPKTADISSGAVPYAFATPAKPEQTSEVAYYPLLDGDETQEADQVTHIIQTYQRQDPNASIAILVRSRFHLRAIVPALQQADIAFQAIDIDPLAARPEIRDLTTLTRALLHNADRIAWLALLRTPWCGFTLKDLHCIAQAAANHTLWDILQQPPSIDLSDDGQQRLLSLQKILQNSFQLQGRLSLSQWIHHTWEALQGPNILNDANALANCQRFFELLQQLDEQGPLALDQLQQQLQKLYARPTPDANAKVQIMTIHKAKGLEFDHVILPGLNRKTASDQHQLLMWLEKPNLLGSSDLILAPIKATHIQKDAIYTYLRLLEKQKLQHEMARLLYVATTRAKSSLHLIATLSSDPKKPQQLIEPASGSFLSMLWPAYHHAEPITSPTSDSKQNPATAATITYLQRVAQLNTPELIPTATSNANIQYAYTPNQHQAQCLGTIIHEALQQLADSDLKTIDMDTLKQHWQTRLSQFGIKNSAMTASMQTIEHAIQTTLNDQQGQWLLSPQQDSRNEYALTAVIDGSVKQLIIDRTFIDENNQRWIIDYKTATPKETQSLADFLIEQCAEHTAQLTLYAQAMALQDTRPIQLALYFPHCGVLHRLPGND